MPWHCEMGGQSKSIKSINSGQGLRDPSPQGDPDNHQILLFKRWHVYKLFKPLSLFGNSEHRVFVCYIELIYYHFLWECQLACFLVCLFQKSWTGCGATLWYLSNLTVYAFTVLSSMRYFYQIQQWKQEEFGWERKQAATTMNNKCSDRVKFWNIRNKTSNIVNLNYFYINKHLFTFSVVWVIRRKKNDISQTCFHLLHCPNVLLLFLHK